MSAETYLALRREFVLKVDGQRPILYALEPLNTNVLVLQPLEGFTLSLLSGDRTLGDVEATVGALFPDASPALLGDLLADVDERVRTHPSTTGIGKDGLIEASAAPIAHAPRYDPRQFVVSPAAFAERMSDVRRRLRLETPVNLYTIFTHRCMTNCLYCYAERKPSREMPLSRWRELIAEAHEMGIMLCSPDNGDTFARRDGVELIECLLEHEMQFLLSTKAYLSKEMIGRMIDAGFTKRVRGVLPRRLQLSVDAVDESVSRRILGIARPRVAENQRTVENLLSFGVMPKVKGVITGLNADQPKKIVDAFYPAGARVFHFVRYTRTLHRHTDDLFVAPEHAPLLAEQFARIRDEYPDVELVENLTGSFAQPEPTAEQRREAWDTRSGCGGGWFALGIAPDGKAFLCEQMTLDEPYVVGDASVQSIAEIWNGAALADFLYPERERFAGTACATCDDFETCMWEKGRCYRNAYYAYGSIYDQPPLCPYNERPGLRMV
jgi:radical SAM protein with 4Fe4S-binding SPASM domain